MSFTNKSRINFLRKRINELTVIILSTNKEQAFLAYLGKISGQHISPKIIEDERWDFMLPAEKNEFLFDYCHQLRTELLTLTKKQNSFPTLQAMNEWFESPWFKSATLAVALIETAKVLYTLITTVGLCLVEETDNHA